MGPRKRWAITQATRATPKDATAPLLCEKTMMIAPAIAITVGVITLQNGRRRIRLAATARHVAQIRIKKLPSTFGC